MGGNKPTSRIFPASGVLFSLGLPFGRGSHPQAPQPKMSRWLGKGTGGPVSPVPRGLHGAFVRPFGGGSFRFVVKWGGSILLFGNLDLSRISPTKDERGLAQPSMGKEQQKAAKHSGRYPAPIPLRLWFYLVGFEERHGTPLCSQVSMSEAKGSTPK